MRRSSSSKSKSLKKSKSWRIALLWAHAYLIRFSDGSTNGKDSNVSINNSDESEECKLYLARSSTAEKDNEGSLSMYAGVDMEEGSLIGIPELAIPVINVAKYNPEEEEEFFTEQTNFMWTAVTTGATLETMQQEGEEVIVSIPGTGALGVEHPSMANADWNQQSVLLRTGDAEEAHLSHVGRGAYSQYFNNTLQALSFIPRGMEILVTFNSNFDQSYHDLEYLSPTDYSEADQLLAKILAHVDQYSDPLRKSSVYSYLINDVLQFVGTPTANSDHRQNKPTLRQLIADEFPKHLHQIQTATNAPLSTFHYSHSHLTKPLSWLNQNGQCMDAIYPAKSTIPHAGMGAFATKDIQPGHLILPAPLLKIDNREWMHMDHAHTNNQHHQLLLNYCFAHPQSSLLLYPAGVGTNYINHQPSPIANAKIIWTNQPYHNVQWMSQSVQQLADGHHTGLHLGFDIVATRQIHKGEEIFMDYGHDWAQAWNQHETLWNQKYNNGHKWPLRALEFNAQNHQHYHTLREREELGSQMDGQDPYPDNIITVCFVMSTDLDDNDESPRKIKNMDVYQFDRDEDFDNVIIHGDNMKSCDIIDRQKHVSNSSITTYTYTAIIYTDEEEQHEYVVKYIPHRAIRFADRPYTSDLHLTASFRHPIQIPDDIFPDAWRDLK